MEITKREILFSTIILAVMVGLGVLISNPIISSITDNALDIVCSVQVKDSSKFDYIRRTDVGDFLAEGKLIAIDSVSILDIQGYYSKIEKVKEEYRMHTRVVTTTDSKGHTHSHTETYWSWDEVDSWKWESKSLSFLGQNFSPKEIQYRYHTHYQETITPERELFGSKIRYRYFTCPTSDHGVLLGNINNKSYLNLRFKSNTNIEKIVEAAQSDINATPIIFWVIWLIFTAGLITLFYNAKNKWLYDKRKTTNTRY